mgnify:CR=1 FL=1
MNREAVTQMDPETGIIWYLSKRADWTTDIWFAGLVKEGDAALAYGIDKKFPGEPVFARPVEMSLGNRFRDID